MTDGLFGVVHPVLLHCSLGEPADHFLLIRHEANHGVECVSVRGEQLVEVAHLVGGAGVPIEKEAARQSAGVVLAVSIPLTLILWGVLL